MRHAALWKTYIETGSPEARATLLDSYLGLISHVVSSLRRTLSTEVSYEDLLGPGAVGLINALESFDPTRGFEFTTYAIPRIRGAILDDLRCRDSASRSMRRHLKSLRAAEERLRGKLAREPRVPETAAEIGVEPETVWAWKRAAVKEVSLQACEGSEDSRTPIVLGQPPTVEPRLDHEERVAAVADALGEITERKRLVLALYYHEELTLREIAEVLGVTESRVSQIRGEALRELRALLGQD